MVRFAVPLLLGAVAFSQTLEMPPLAVTRDSGGSLRVILKANPDRPVAAIQWELVLPAGLRLEPSEASTGPAARSAGKGLTCAKRENPDQGPVLICILAGGMDTLQGGVVASFKVSTAESSPPGAATVRLQKALGVSADLNAVPMPDVRTIVSIR